MSVERGGESLLRRTDKRFVEAIDEVLLAACLLHLHRRLHSYTSSPAMKKYVECFYYKHRLLYSNVSEKALFTTPCLL